MSLHKLFRIPSRNKIKDLIKIAQSEGWVSDLTCEDIDNDSNLGDFPVIFTQAVAGKLVRVQYIYNVEGASAFLDIDYSEYIQLK